MSYSKRTHISAYQMYSSENTKSDRQNNYYNTDDSQMNHSNKYLNRTAEKRRKSSRGAHRHREKSHDSDEEVLKGYTPKSPQSSSLSKDLSPEKQKMLEPLMQKEDMGGRRFEDDKKSSAQSLMDIDFSGGQSHVSRSSLHRLKDMSSNHDYSSGEESHEHLDDWKDGRRYSKYSNSEEEGDSWNNANKGRRTWKNSTSAGPYSDYHSRAETFVGDSSDRSKNSEYRRKSGDSQPKSLLDTYIPPLTKKPVSLLDLAGGRSESRYKRKPSRRSHLSSPDKKSAANTVTNSERMSDGEDKGTAPSRKRSTSDADQDVPVKKAKSVKSKAGSKDRVSVVDASRISVCKCSGHTFLVIPSFLPTLYLHGRGKITVLMGTINILGCKLRTGTTYDVYSPASGSLLAMQAGNGDKYNASDVKEELSKFNIPENDKDLETIGNNTIAVVMVDWLDSTMCDYVTTFIPYTQLFTAVPVRDVEACEQKGVTLSKLGLKVAPMKEMIPACMNLSQDYEEVLLKWAKRLSAHIDGNKAPVVLCCGTKNTGKSTLNRLLINTALRCVGAVAYLECDVGQAEFSPPATLSLHVLKQPVLEPPFCHQKHAEKMVFYGESTPSYDPNLYAQCLKYIVEAYNDLSPQLPLIVNTMGFTEGVGVMLLIDTVQLVKPDLVVQLESFNQAANLPPLTQEFVALEEGWMFNKTPTADPKQKIAETQSHELVQLQTLISQRRDFSFKLKPVDLRNLTLLAALSMNLERGMTLTSLPPYTVPYRQLGVFMCHNRLDGEETLAAMDASVVALCVADLSKAERKSEDLPLVFPEMPVCTCLGLGIVRGIDVKRGLLYLVTTLPRVYLQKMNTILKGSLTLPDQMFLKQKSSEPIPYVDALAPSTAVASLRPRSRMPRMSLRAAK